MIDWTEADLERYLADDPGGPVVMLNLLRFQPDGGLESYGRYREHLGGLGSDYGLEIIYAGAGGAALVGGLGQAWDMVALIRYPSRQHFGEMVRDPRYVAGEHFRRDALIESVLQPTTQIAPT